MMVVSLDHGRMSYRVTSSNNTWYSSQSLDASIAAQSMKAGICKPSRYVDIHLITLAELYVFYE